MLLDAGYYAPADLTGYVRAALSSYAINRFQLSGFLPDRAVNDLEYRFVSGGQGLADAATFRAYDAESPIGFRKGVTRVSGELPPISRKLRLGEYDRLRQRTDPGVEIQLGLENDAERLALGIAARMELARGDALVNGSVTISENGLSATVSFSRSGSASVTPATVWTDATNADPINDLITWVQAYTDMNGVPPGVLIMSRTIVGYLALAAKVRALAATVVGTPTRVSNAALQETFSDFGIPPFQMYDASVNVNGSATRIVPADKVLLLPAAVASDDFGGTELGATLWGTTAESLEPNYGLAGEDQPGIVAGVYSEEDPVSLWTKAAAIGLPVLANPNLAWVADIN